MTRRSQAEGASVHMPLPEAGRALLTPLVGGDARRLEGVEVGEGAGPDVGGVVPLRRRVHLE